MLQMCIRQVWKCVCVFFSPSLKSLVCSTVNKLKLLQHAVSIVSCLFVMQIVMSLHNISQTKENYSTISVFKIASYCWINIALLRVTDKLTRA